MLHYIIRRLLLIIPTLLGIMVINFAIVQIAPGGPVEQMIAKLTGAAHGATTRFSGSGASEVSGASQGGQRAILDTNNVSKYRGAQGLDPDLVKEIEKIYGFDKPAYVRFMDMLKRYVHLDFGESFFRSDSVIHLMLEKMPVSISLGLWTTLIIYMISIPLGIHKAVRDGTEFDVWTSTVIAIGYAIPNFLFAILLIILFAGGSYWQIFPLRGLISEDVASMNFWHKFLDYTWHLVLPITAMVISGFASLTMLCKNSFLDEISKHYVVTARAKGLSEKSVLYGHVFRNAMLIVISGIPDAFLKIFFTGALLIEIIFSLDGLGLLGYESAMTRDYPVMFGTLFLYTFLGLIFNLISDLVYVMVDPRINFEGRS